MSYRSTALEPRKHGGSGVPPGFGRPAPSSMPHGAVQLWLGFLLLTGAGQGNCQIDRTSQVEIFRALRQAALPPMPALPGAHEPPEPPGPDGQSNGPGEAAIQRPISGPRGLRMPIAGVSVSTLSNLDAAERDMAARREDHRKDMRLWAEVRRARASGDPKAISAAEQALADYLSARLARTRGKTYPPGTSLTTILKEIRALARHRSPRRWWVLVTLATVAVAPLAVLALCRLRERRLRSHLTDPAQRFIP